MRQVVCIRERHGHALGETVEVPDGAEVSEAWFAEPGSHAALRAIADAQEAARAAESAQEPGPPPEPPAAAGVAGLPAPAAEGV